MNFLEFVRTYNIDHRTSGHKHCREGWIQVECPFCVGNSGYHLGYSLHGAYCHCWRCGWHNLPSTVVQLANCGWKRAYEIIKEFGGDACDAPRHEPTEADPNRVVELPPGTRPMRDIHTRYLAERGFSPAELRKTWDLMGTDWFGPYKFRIVVPIMYRNELVSYQCRDVTDKSPLKYKACAKSDEKIHHKHILYGMDKVPASSVIVVEGVTDVWNMGAGTVATFGTEYTTEQINMLSRFRKVVVLFDPGEVQAKRKGEKLRDELAVMGVHSFCLKVDHEGDPASFPEKLVKDIRFHCLGVSF